MEAKNNVLEEWPTFPENENKFDWSMSYAKIDQLYASEVRNHEPFSPSHGYKTRKQRRNWFLKREQEKLINFLP